MTVSVVFAIAGVIALLFGIVGGGIKAKEIEVPLLPIRARIVTIIIGLILISITLWLENDKSTQVIPTPTVTLTASSTSTPPTATFQVLSTATLTQTILLQESFSSNNIGWKEGIFSDDLADMANEFVNGQLHRTATGKGSFIERTWVPNITLKDLRLSFDAIIVDAPNDGIVCIGLRRSSDNDNYYHIYFGVNSIYGVKLVKEGVSTTIYEAKLPNDIKIEEGIQNNFNITVQGPLITIVVNDKTLTTINDSGLMEPGNIGLGVGLRNEHETAETMIVEFDNLIIWSMP